MISNLSDLIEALDLNLMPRMAREIMDNIEALRGLGIPDDEIYRSLKMRMEESERKHGTAGPNGKLP